MHVTTTQLTFWITLPPGPDMTYKAHTPLLYYYKSSSDVAITAARKTHFQCWDVLFFHQIKLWQPKTGKPKVRPLIKKLGVVNKACLADTVCTDSGNGVYKHVSVWELHRDKIENQSSWSSKWFWAMLQSSPIKKCPSQNLTLPYVARGSRARLLAGVDWTQWSSTAAGSPEGLSG